MPLRNMMVALIVSIGLLLLIIELVRKRKLREEYSWLWLLTASTILVLTLWIDLLRRITFLVGAVIPSSTIFMLAFLFLIFITLHDLRFTLHGSISGTATWRDIARRCRAR